MKSIINWAKLVEQNRVKAVGIPWTDEETAAIKSGISHDDVRAGILKKEVVGEQPKSESVSTEEKPIHYWTKKDLVIKAKELGMSFDEDSVSRGDLIVEIKKILEKNETKK